MAPRKKTEEKTVTETTPNTETTALHVGDMVYDRSVLATVNAGGADGATITTEQASKLVGLGLIVTHPDGPNAEGNVLVALTDLGREAQAFNEANPQDAATVKKTRAKSDIQFGSATVSDDDIPLPPSNRRGRTGEKYPFASRAKGKSFHIPVVVPEGGDGAELAKKALSTIASSVSTNNKKYKDTPHPVDNAVGAKFQAKAVGAEDPEGFGVRVWRIS